MKTRISKKSLSALPSAVAEKISSLGEEFGIKSFTYSHIASGTKMYIGEGNRWVLINSEGEALGFEVAGEHNICASNLNTADWINKGFVMPVGAWAIRISYYTRFWMDVYNAGLPAITEGK